MHARFTSAVSAVLVAACASTPPMIERYSAPTTEREKTAETARSKAIAWLLAQQAEDGSFPCEVAPQHTVATTALAALALTLDSEPSRQDSNQAPVKRAIIWLVEQQRSDGQVGEPIGASAHYNHGIAALAMAEAYGKSRNFFLRGYAQRAVNYVLAARNPERAWRYDMPPSGDNDTSVSGWMVLALDAARRFGLAVDGHPFEGASAWFDEVTDPVTGRSGYDRPGTRSSRTTRVNDDFPVESGEALTAIALLGRRLTGQSRPELDRRQVALLAARPPLWSADGRMNDFYYWFFATRALRRAGDAQVWERWSTALADSLVLAQEPAGEAAGSWPPRDPWSYAGGRVYGTALLALSLAELCAPRE